LPALPGWLFSSCVGTTTAGRFDGFDSLDEGCTGTTTEGELFADDGEARRESRIALSFSINNLEEVLEEAGAGVSTLALRCWASPEER